MTILLDLEPDLEAQVAAQAQRQGVPLPQNLHGLIAQAASAAAPEAPGWPDGFFANTFGILAADPLARLPQGEIAAQRGFPA